MYRLLIFGFCIIVVFLAFYLTIWKKMFSKSNDKYNDDCTTSNSEKVKSCTCGCKCNKE